MHSGRERGQSLVLIALLMIGMLAFLGLIIDGGYAFVNRRWGQDAADAAAFAGARELALGRSESVISNTITTFALANRTANATDLTAYYIDQNGNNLAKIPNGSVPSLATGVRVTATLRFQPYFISIMIGNNPVPIQSVAAAQSGPPSAGALLAPMTLPFPCNYDPLNPTACPLETGKIYRLMGDSQLPGGFQWVDFSGGSSSQDIEKYLKLLWNGPVVMADKSNTYYNPLNPTQYNTPPPNPNPWIPSGPGVQPNSGIQEALDCWIDLNGTGCWQGAGWGPKPSDNKWTVPVYNVNNLLTGSNAKYHVVMLAEFQLEGYWFANNQCNWAGKPATKNNPCDNKPTGVLSPDLVPCLTAGQKCIIGRFLNEAKNLQIVPGKCNTMGLDICGVGLSE